MVVAAEVFTSFGDLDPPGPTWTGFSVMLLSALYGLYQNGQPPPEV